MDPLSLLIASALSLPAQQNGVVGAAQRPAAQDLSARDDTVWEAEIAEASRRSSVPEAWIRAVIEAESGGIVNAVSPKGAIGLMQLMPETYEAMRAEYGLGSNPFEPHDNILAGTAYLKQMLDRYGVPAFLAAYNAGPQRLDETLAGLAPLPDETVRFVTKVGGRIGFDAAAIAQLTGAEHPTALTSGLFFQSVPSLNHDARAPSWRHIFVNLGDGKTGP